MVINSLGEANSFSKSVSVLINSTMRGPSSPRNCTTLKNELEIAVAKHQVPNKAMKSTTCHMG